jgi:hypothetical protein
MIERRAAGDDGHERDGERGRRNADECHINQEGRQTVSGAREREPQRDALWREEIAFAPCTARDHGLRPISVK